MNQPFIQAQISIKSCSPAESYAVSLYSAKFKRELTQFILQTLTNSKFDLGAAAWKIGTTPLLYMLFNIPFVKIWSALFIAYSVGKDYFVGTGCLNICKLVGSGVIIT